ncbi:MAG: threonylcarbamoyladenosine tRNA methylthiotransferase MtaB [Desulforhopalus sp.]|jgi:threonylcarbamoyladenosine tRNA methylthiotransferase MtaB
MKKVFITTLGCKVNQYESASFKTSFADAGVEIVDKNEPADIVIINSCTVTGNASAQSRQTIHKMARQNPNAKIIVTGCYAELAADELAKDEALTGRDYTLIGNSKKDILVSTALEDYAATTKIILGSIKDAKEICELPVRKFGERTRAYLRIQDGCESFCSYCIVPYTRGPSRSLAPEKVIEQARIFEQEGHKEIVLTGIHIGYYGKDLTGGNNIVTLIDQLTLATPEVQYRISSLEPIEITDELLQLVTTRPNIQNHLHIPLQSGSDEILKRMNRRYTTATFKEIVENCKKYLPDAAIGIDILAGFPGETDEQFEQAIDFLQNLDFTYLHVFPYSIRPGTPAATYPDQVEKNIKEQRVAKLRKLSDYKRDTFYKNQLEQTVTVLVEGQRDDTGLLKGFSDNYVAVRFKGDETLINQRVQVKLKALINNYVLGEDIGSNES